MSKFRKTPRPEVPSLNTASLPDLVFTLLFFFLLVTNLQGNVPNVQFKEPEATEYADLDKQNLNVFVYVGKPTIEFDGNISPGFRIQIEDHWMEPEEIAPYFIQKKAGMSLEEAEQLTVCIRADKDTDLKTISAIEQALREARILKVNYGVETRHATSP